MHIRNFFLIILNGYHMIEILDIKVIMKLEVKSYYHPAIVV